MTVQNHIIKKQILDLNLDSDIGSFALQSRVSDIYKTEIIPLIAEHFDRISRDSEVFRIDKLEIELGTLNKNSLETDFKNKINELFPKKLSEAMNKTISGRSFYDDGETATTRESRDLELLEFFFKEGRLPWWVKTGELIDISTLLEQKVTKQPTEAKKLISGIADNPASVKRLLYHADAPIIKKIIALFQRRQYKEVCKLSHNLVVLFTRAPFLSAFSPARVRVEVWSAILSYTLNSEDRVFNRRYLAENTIKHLVKTFGVDYNKLDSYFRKSYKVGWFEAMVQTGLRENVTGRKRRRDNGHGKPLPAKIVEDSRTNEYLQYLEIIEKLVKDLQLILQNGTISASSSVTQHIAELTAGLEQVGKSIKDINNMIVDLLERTGKSSVFWLSPTELDERFKNRIEEFEELIEKLYFTMTVVLDQKERQAEDCTRAFLKKVEKTMDSINRLREKRLPPGELFETDSFADSEEIYLRNAGIVLLWPYLTGFFETIGLVKEKSFISEEAKERAILLLHYLAFGTGHAQEYDLTLNKILCGLDPGTPVKPSSDITQRERDDCENLLQVVVFNWPALKNISVPGLRSMFLRREGMVISRDGFHARARVLRVAEESYDILLDKMPWGIGTVKLPWMEQLLFVEWRI